jgi:hypothetical protein
MPINLGGNTLNSLGTKLLNDTSVVTSGSILYLDAGIATSYGGSGTTWTDLTTSGYNATLQNGPTYSTVSGGAIVFDGTNDNATTGVTGIVPIGSSPYTVSVWLYRNRSNAGYEEVLSQWTSANSGNSFYFGFNNSNVRFSDGSWNDVVVSGAGNIEVWMNLVGVSTGTNAFIYLNSSLAATRGSALTYGGVGPFVIGKQGALDGEYFGGRIGNILVYNRALSGAEILQNYQVQRQRFGL